MAPFIFTRRVMAGLPIRRFGDGSSQRDYTYIDDIVAGVCAALDRDCEYEIFNLGNGRPIALSRFIALVEQAVGRPARIEELPMQPGDVQHTWADISKAERMLDYTPRTAFEDGLAKFVEWYAAHQDLYAGG
jgi:UDP-glucuronate 4-epimerase